MASSQGKKPTRRTSDAKHAETPPPSSDIIEPTRLKVLVVDDDSVDRLTTCKALQSGKLHAAIEEVETMAAAMQRLRAARYDVVILDHLLPDGKSMDFLRELRSRGIRVPVVVATGYGDESLVVELLKGGAGDYVPKDRITAESMFRAVSHAIRIHKAEEESLRRDALLEASAQAAAILHGDADRLSVISGALGVLGRAVGADRLAVFEIHPQPETHAPAMSHRYDWDGAGDEVRVRQTQIQNRSFEELGLARWHAVLIAGHVIAGLVSAFPEFERPILEARGIKSLLAVPVMIGGRCWGFVQIEAIHAERVWTEQEKHILLTLATGIGGTLLHRQADEARRRNEAFYREIVNQQTELVCRFTPDFRLTFVNDAYARFCGRTREELIGADFRNFVPPGQRDAIAGDIHALTFAQPIGTHENDITTADGRPRWIQWTNHAVFDDQGAIREYQSVGRDVTQLRQAERALHESRDYLEQIINSISDPVFVKDEDRRFALVNEAFCRFTGFRREELIGKTDDSFFPPDQVEVFRVMDRKVFETGAEIVNEEELTDATGRIRTIITKKTLYWDPRGQRYIVGIIRDVTALKTAERNAREREEQYRTLIENLAVGVFRTTRDGRVLQANKAHAEMLGFPSVEAFLKAAVPQFYRDPDERRRVWEEIQKQGAVRDRELNLQRADGTPIVATLSAKAHYGKDGKLDWVDGVIDDITERKNAAESLQAAMTRLKELESAINRSPAVVFVWRVAENWPVEFVSGNVERLLEYTPDDLMSGRVSWVGVTHPDDVPRLEKEVAGHIADGRDEFIQQYRLITRSGKIRWIEDRTRAVRDEAGKATHFEGILLDITGRHEAELALQESEARFREFAEMMPQTVFETDMNGRLTFVNKSALASWGFLAEDIERGVSTLDIMVPEDHERVRNGMARRFEGDISGHEYTARRKDGSTFPVIIYAVPIVRDGRPVGIRGLAIDITDRKRHETLLRESEERYRSLSEGSPDMIYLCDRAGDILYVNAIGAAQIGMPADEVAGKTQEQLFPPENAARHKQAIGIVFETGRMFASEVPELLHRTQVWIDTRLVPIRDADGRTTAVLGISRDITARKKMEQALRESEENFRALAQNAMDGIMIIEEDGHVLYANVAMARIVECAPEEMVGKTIADLSPPEDHGKLYEWHRRIMADDPSIRRFEARCLGKSGIIVPVEVSITLTTWQNRRAAMGILRDISERQRMEQERRKYAAMLLNVQESERKEISAMLHDHLGQLLTLARLELGSVKAADAESSKGMGTALLRLDEALSSVRGLAVSLRPPILDDLGIEAALESLTEEFTDSSDTEVVFSRKGEPPTLTKEQGTCLYRVLQEALTNVVKHAGASRADVILHADPSGTTIEVADNGKGFDAANDDAPEGIGLLGMRERLANCGGTLDVQSREGGGTTIRAFIPLGRMGGGKP